MASNLSESITERRADPAPSTAGGPTPSTAGGPTPSTAGGPAAPAAMIVPDVVDRSRLLTTFEIATILATEHDLDLMLSKFLTCLTTTLEAAQYGILLLYEPEAGKLRARAARGYSLDLLQDIRISPGEGVTGRTFLSGQPEFFSTQAEIATARQNLTPRNRALFERAIADLELAQSSICLPLTTGKATIGVLMLENLRHPHSFATADLPFLHAVAGLIALSIENALLRQEVQTTQALREANRLKTELISTLAHEIRTPLTSIKGYSTALLMEEASFSTQDQHEFLQIIDEECDILESLVHDLLESSVIDAGLLKLELQPVRLPSIAETVVQDFARRSEKHRLLVDFEDGFPILDADPDRVSQVLRNLLDNAIKYSPDGGLIVVRGQVATNEVVVSVADQGVGLAPEHLNRLFEIGFRVKSGLIRHIAGSGLGLPICQTIVESHGGRIWAESELGRGTTLFFSLPIQKQSQLGAKGDNHGRDVQDFGGG